MPWPDASLALGFPSFKACFANVAHPRQWGRRFNSPREPGPFTYSSLQEAEGILRQALQELITEASGEGQAVT